MRRMLSIAVASAIAATSVVALGGPVNADSTPTISVRGNGSDVTLSRGSVHAGRLDFRVSTTNADTGSDIVLFKPAKYVTLDRVFADFREEFSSDLATAARGTRHLTRDARFYGLAQVVASRPVLVTQVLDGGTYYLMDATRLDRERPDVVALRVRGDADDERLGNADATVSMTSTDRFVSPRRLPRAGSLIVKNTSDTIHFMSMMPVARGTTDADVQRYFDSGSSQPPPFAVEGPSEGVGPMSPGRKLRFAYRLPAGTYVLLCFVADEETGVPHAAMGMHKVVVLR